MAHKTEGDCPVGTAVFIKNQAKRLGVSIEKTIDLYAKESGIPRGTLHKWVWPSSPPKNGRTSKPLKKRTKPETKSQISKVAKEIESGEISDDDAKVVGDAMAKAIKSGKAAPRIGSAVATAVRKSHKKGVRKPIKEPDNFQRLWKHILAAVEGLTYFADGMITPTTEDELNAAKGILEAASSMITQYARLGVDVVGIYETFVTPKEATNEIERKKIDIGEGSD